jgi:hypothetical protein
MSLVRPASVTTLLVAFALTTGVTWADTQGEAASCRPSRGSLTYIGCHLAEQLGPTATGASVAVIDLKSDRELPAADALRGRVQSAVAAALRPAAGETKSAERGKLRVELGIEKNGGVLRVRADLRRATGLWQRIRHAKPGAEQHAFVEAPLDAELRALIPPPPLVVSEVLKLKAPERGIVALACGPLGSDGGQELALVSRGSVRVGRIAGRAFVERKKAAWSALSAVAAVPLREPIASAEITPEGTLRVGLSDRKDGLELSRDLAVTQRFEGLLPLPGGGCTPRSGVGLLGQLGPCLPPGLGPIRSLPTTVDAVAGSPLGWLGRELASGRLIGVRPELVQATSHVGAQLAIGDADSDGSPELAYSADTLDTTKDRLTLVTLSENKLTPRFELPAPGISAIAICSSREGPGMAPIAIATGDQLWLIR